MFRNLFCTSKIMRQDKRYVSKRLVNWRITSINKSNTKKEQVAIVDSVLSQLINANIDLVSV